MASQQVSAGQELKGKRALVTGAARRIGREVALELARAGADVTITFRNSDREARKTVIELSSLGVRAFALKCDVRDQKSVKTMIAEAKRELGGIDILVNNAGAYETVAFEKITVEQWDDIFATNARGAFLVSQAATKELRKNKGRIVNIGSLGGMQPWATHIHYCASKAALHMLTQATAKALAPDVTVNCVAPGMIPMDYTTPKSQLKHFSRQDSYETQWHRERCCDRGAVSGGDITVRYGTDTDGRWRPRIIVTN